MPDAVTAITTRIVGMILPLASAQKVAFAACRSGRLFSPGAIAFALMPLNSCPIAFLDPAEQDHTATWAMGLGKSHAASRTVSSRSSLVFQWSDQLREIHELYRHLERRKKGRRPVISQSRVTSA